MKKINFKYAMVLGIALALLQACAKFEGSPSKPKAPEPIIIVDPKVKELLPQTGLSAVVYGYLVKDENNLKMFAKGNAAFLKNPYSFEIDPRVIAQDFSKHYYFEWIKENPPKDAPKPDTSKLSPKAKKLASRNIQEVDLAGNYDPSSVQEFQLKFSYGAITEPEANMDAQSLKMLKELDNETRRNYLPEDFTYTPESGSKLLTLKLAKEDYPFGGDEEIVLKSLTNVSAKVAGIKSTAKLKTKSILSDTLTTESMPCSFPKLLSSPPEPVEEIGQTIDIAKLGEDLSMELDLNKDWRFAWAPSKDAQPSIISIRFDVINEKWKPGDPTQNELKGWGFADCLDSAGFCDVPKEKRKGKLELKEDGLKGELTVYRIVPNPFTFTTEKDGKLSDEQQGLIILGVGSSKIVSYTKITEAPKKK